LLVRDHFQLLDFGAPKIVMHLVVHAMLNQGKFVNQTLGSKNIVYRSKLSGKSYKQRFLNPVSYRQMSLKSNILLPKLQDLDAFSPSVINIVS
jgi:hypothetical protein